MDHAIIRPSQSLVKGGGLTAQFRLSDGAYGTYPLLTLCKEVVDGWPTNRKQASTLTL